MDIPFDYQPECQRYKTAVHSAIAPPHRLRHAYTGASAAPLPDGMLCPVSRGMKEAPSRELPLNRVVGPPYSPGACARA